MSFLRRLFCLHSWANVHSGDFTEVRVRGWSGSHLYSFWKCDLHCIKCGKKQIVQDGRGVSMLPSQSGTYKGVVIKLNALGVKVFGKNENGETVRVVVRAE